MGELKILVGLVELGWDVVDVEGFASGELEGFNRAGVRDWGG